MWWLRLRYLLLLVALCAIATCPAARRACIARTRAAEADQLLAYLADRVEAHAAATGRVPPTAAGPTPRACCEQGGQGGQGKATGECSPDAAAWAQPGWRELGFSIDGPHRYTYQYLPEPSGLSATLRAVADLACDGSTSTVELKLVVVGGKLTRAWSRSTPVH